MTDKTTLRSVPLLADLPEAAIKDLSQRCSWKSFAAGEQIIDRKSDSCDLYFIVHGRARVVIYSLSGREISFDDREGGEYFGEISALDGKPRSANVLALDDTIVAVLSQTGFHDMLLAYPQVSLRILKNLARIVRISNDRVMDLSTLGANHRVQAELLRLATNNIRDDNTARISPSPIHGDIASRVSTTRETVARVFSELMRESIIKREQDALIILDVDRLTYRVEEVRGDSE